MARYEHRPIYKKAMDLTKYFEKIVRNFSHHHKYSRERAEGKEQGVGELGAFARKFPTCLRRTFQLLTKMEVQAMCKKELYVPGAAIVMIIAFVMFFPLIGTTGDLEPGTAPAPTMKTLDQIPPTWSQNIPVANRFELVLDGAAVLDKETGLVWERSPSTGTVQWRWANSTCYVNRKLGNRRGWRLPTIEELLSLIDKSVAGPPYLPTGHPFITNAQSSFYWSATTSAIDTDKKWTLNFNTAEIGNHDKSNSFYVWCVRGGQGYDAY
jgi:hypothetical protein